MSKATYTVVTLALLVLVGAANAAPVSVRMDAHNQRSNSGTFSTLKWKTCTPVGTLTPCLSTTNAWTLANATGSDAVWTWDAATGVLAMTGTFQSTSFVGSNANGSPVISDKVVDLTIDTTNNTTTATSYQCIEGTFLASVGAVGCLNVSTGDDFATNTTALYNVGGNVNCIQRTIGGDDVSTGNPRGVTTRVAAPPCDALDGGFDLWDVELDNTATGGQLIIRNSVATTLPGTNFLTFTAVASAADDGPFNAQQNVPLTIDVLENDTNFTDPVTVTVSTAPTQGTATIIGTSPGAQAGIQIQYTANTGASGSDSFVYTVVSSDGITSDTATVTLNILAGGANDDTATTTRNSAAIDINVGANDVDFTNPVTIAITSAPDQGGTATPPASGPIANAIVSYTPATTAPGTPTYTETFVYEVTDANDLVATATVTVTVNNSVPVAGDGTVTISTQGSAPGSLPGTFNAGTLAGNNVGNTPTVVTATQGANGATTVSGNVVSYVPAATFFKGTDTFDYTITDSDPGTPESDSGTVTVTIADVSPTITGSAITTTVDTASVPRTITFTAGNGSTAQHDFDVSTQATNGSCAVTGPSLTYTPNAAYTGPDSCVVTVTDEDGAGQSATATFTITVNAGSSGGGGGNGGLLPGGSGAVDPWSLALLAGLPLLVRRRASRRGQAALNQ